MAVYAGVDEAGYGPMLGPLVVGCAALDSERPEAELWQDLASVVHLSADRWDGLVVQDSKLLFRRASGIRRLEEGCLSFAGSATGRRPETLGDLLRSLNAPFSLDSYPWYELAEAMPVPLAADPARIDEFSSALTSAIGSAKVRIAMLRAQPVFSGMFNDEVAGGKSKSDVVFQRVVAHVRALLESTTGDIFLTCDKLGGRNHYAAMLHHSFGAWVNILREGHTSSHYSMELQGRSVHISFVQDGEREAPTVALASMFSKYLRELFLHLLNNYWCERVHGLTPTSGYVQDARRFIGSIDGHPDYEKYQPLLVRLK